MYIFNGERTVHIGVRLHILIPSILFFLIYNIVLINSTIELELLIILIICVKIFFEKMDIMKNVIKIVLIQIH